jgi:hypothetical protein
MKKYVLFLVTAFFVTALMAGSTSALDVQPGVDLFETPPGFTEASPAIPADFFGPGSDPFVGTIALRGKSLKQEGANLGRTSTIVQRLTTAPLPDPYGGSAAVPIEIIALNLVSVEPIIVTYDGGLNPELWDVQVNLSSVDPQSTGTMTINQEYTGGGTFSADLPVTTRFTFIRQEDGHELVMDPMPLDVMLTPPIPLPPQPAQSCWSYEVDFPIVTSDGSSSVDHDGNPLTPMISVGPSSNFVAGGCGFTASGERPIGFDPVNYQQKVLDPETAAWAAHGVQPTNPLDHFKVYDVDTVLTAHTVTLEDQFDQGEVEQGTLVRIDRFANPVDKNGEGIADPNAHLVWYRFVPTAWVPSCSLTVENQFGVQKLMVGRPQYLLVPAEKVEPGSEFPVNLDHYKCYQVCDNEGPINASVTLDDQFGHEDVLVTYPCWFCNPVSKNGEGIISEVDHLVFYQINPMGSYFIDITAVDQFGSHVLHVDSSRWLGVPTEKHEWRCDIISPYTLIKLSNVAAEPKGGAIEITWVTLTEINSAGFNVRRSLTKDGVYSKINVEVIPARGNELQGASYAFVDADVTRGLTYYYRLEEVDLNGKGSTIATVSATLRAGATPAAFKLHQNCPNPFNPTTEITYDLPVDCHVTLEVYNVIGQRVATLVNEFQEAGNKVVRWDSRDAKGLAETSGIYFYRLQAGDFTAVKKMVLLK